jgi:Domain of unknown function (DUF4383)
VRKLVTAESLAALAGLVFVVLGVCGFVPGAVQHFGALHWWKNGSGAELFGLFQTSILLNLAHVGLGVAGLVAASSEATARAYLAVGGAACFALGIYGLLIDRRGDSNVFSLDRAGIWLHVGLGVALVYAGLAAALDRLRPATAP